MIQFGMSYFSPVPLCNTYSMHILLYNEKNHVMVVDLNGVLRWRNNDQTTNLKELVVENIPGDCSVEMVSCDAFSVPTEDEFISYLGTCWVVYDHLLQPSSFFASLFMLKNFQVSQWLKFHIPQAPTFTKFFNTAPLEPNINYWSIFTHSQGTTLFEVNMDLKIPFDKRIIGPIPAKDVFPPLEIADLPGSVLRSEIWTTQGQTVVLAGFDSGYVIASACPVGSNTVTDRKTIKFSGPVSVLKLIREQTETTPALVLLSSTVGPATVWALRFEKQGKRLFWEFQTMLKDSEVYDCVITATVTKNFILIGTYGEQLLIYSLEDCLRYPEIEPQATMNVASPILSIIFHDPDSALFVLSSKGFHQYLQLDSSQQPIGQNLEETNSVFDLSPRTSQMLKPL